MVALSLLITIFDPPARCGVGQRSCVVFWQWYNADLTLPCKSNTEHGFLLENIFFKSPMPTMLWATWRMLQDQHDPQSLLINLIIVT